MNLYDGSGSEAKLHYGEAEFDILVAGEYVLCAVTGRRIPLDALRYWNPDRQEAYLDAAAAVRGFGLLEAGK